MRGHTWRYDHFWAEPTNLAENFPQILIVDKPFQVAIIRNLKYIY